MRTAVEVPPTYLWSKSDVLASILILGFGRPPFRLFVCPLSPDSAVDGLAGDPARDANSTHAHSAGQHNSSKQEAKHPEPPPQAGPITASFAKKPACVIREDVSLGLAKYAFRPVVALRYSVDAGDGHHQTATHKPRTLSPDLP